MLYQGVVCDHMSMPGRSQVSTVKCRLKLVGLVVFFAFIAVGTIRAETNGGLPFVETFEDSPADMANALTNVHDQHGWSVSTTIGGAEVQTAEVYAGTNSMSVSNAVASNMFSDESSVKTTVEFWAKPPHRDAYVDVEEGATAVFYVNASSNVVAFNGSNSMILAGLVLIELIL